MDYKKLKDELLIEQFCAGNHKAFDVLFDRYSSRVYAYILHLTRDEELANDLFQDTFFKVIQTLKLHGYREEGKFLQWVTRIAHNLFIDVCRKKARMQIIEPPDEDSDVFDFVIIDDSAKKLAIERKETIHLVRHLIEQLPPEQREVLIMRHYLDMSFKEIAERTNVSINTALGRMRYALINMRKMLSTKLK